MIFILVNRIEKSSGLRLKIDSREHLSSDNPNFRMVFIEDSGEDRRDDESAAGGAAHSTEEQGASMFTTVVTEGLSLTSSAESFVKQRLNMVDARRKFRETHQQEQGAGSSIDEITDYLQHAKDYVSDAKESAKEYLCNAKDYFYTNMQTDSM